MSHIAPPPGIVPHGLATTHGIAQMLGISRTALEAELTTAEVPTVVVDGQTLVSIEDVIEGLLGAE